LAYPARTTRINKFFIAHRTRNHHPRPALALEYGRLEAFAVALLEDLKIDLEVILTWPPKTDPFGMLGFGSKT